MAHRTLHDELSRREVREDARHPLNRRVLAPADGVERVTADFRCRCGSRKAAHLMLDLDNPEVPPAKRLTLAERNALKLGADRYRCDSCWRLWVMTGLIDADRLREATGQPRRENGSNRPW